MSKCFRDSIAAAQTDHLDGQGREAPGVRVRTQHQQILAGLSKNFYFQSHRRRLIPHGPQIMLLLPQLEYSCAGADGPPVPDMSHSNQMLVQRGTPQQSKNVALTGT